MNVAVVGSYSYDTQAGGNTTVPQFQIRKITRKGPAPSRAAVTLRLMGQLPDPSASMSVRTSNAAGLSTAKSTRAVARTSTE
jgi:hypothetical protein